MSEDWSTTNCVLTPTMKSMRTVAEHIYQKVFDSHYSEKEVITSLKLICVEPAQTSLAQHPIVFSCYLLLSGSWSGRNSIIHRPELHCATLLDHQLNAC